MVKDSLIFSERLWGVWIGFALTVKELTWQFVKHIRDIARHLNRLIKTTHIFPSYVSLSAGSHFRSLGFDLKALLQSRKWSPLVILQLFIYSGKNKLFMYCKRLHFLFSVGRDVECFHSIYMVVDSGSYWCSQDLFSITSICESGTSPPVGWTRHLFHNFVLQDLCAHTRNIFKFIYYHLCLFLFQT